jgi:hypothetical protein
MTHLTKPNIAGDDKDDDDDFEGNNNDYDDRAQDDGDGDSGDDTPFNVLFPHNKACAAKKAAPKAAEEDDSDDDEDEDEDDSEREAPAAKKAPPKAAEEDDSDDDDASRRDGRVVRQAVMHLRDVVDRLTIQKLVNIMMPPPPTLNQSEESFRKATKLGKKDSVSCRSQLTYPPPIFWGYFTTRTVQVVLILSCFLSQCPFCPALMPFLPSLVSFIPSSTRFPALPCPSCSCCSSPLPMCLRLPFFFSISFPASSFPFPSQEAHQNCHGPGEGGRARTHTRN